jgi:hypothetical protein
LFVDQVGDAAVFNGIAFSANLCGQVVHCHTSRQGIQCAIKACVKDRGGVPGGCDLQLAEVKETTTLSESKCEALECLLADCHGGLAKRSEIKLLRGS